MAAPLAKTAAITPRPSDETSLQDLLAGYRFSLAASPDEALRALAVRQQVYHVEGGYDVSIPDPYDRRSWALIAEDVATGEIVGTMRAIPRSAGPLELEENFALPSRFVHDDVLELNRFAILPPYRRGRTYLPVVTLGLFKTLYVLNFRLDTRQMVVASKPGRVWSYLWIGFQDTGITAEYAQLGGALHHLLWADFGGGNIIAEHQFRAFFQDYQHDEIVMPAQLPPLDLALRTAAIPTLPLGS